MLDTTLPLRTMGRSRKEVDTSTYTGRFAVRLVYLRTKAKLSVDQLAEKSGIPKRTLHAWESGERSPVIDNFPALAEALGVSIRILMPQE